MTAASPDFLAHRTGDAVAVAVRDLEPGPAEGGYLDSDATERVELDQRVPLGHKVALTAIAKGAQVIEYGLPIGIATTDISRGNYVHTHNVRSARWQNSVA
ncbi:(2R)-sulfolactate sulfo-lyase subunit alpha [Tamaricihabitans halophyticus]|uniref:(2R)-sulfolactate sulfo-lyase subunit alpha n=1 Tax=Tamaricihabitans halophyticus TaxID=1262583 RepID=A0A4R2Q7J5_9PSEU|nr:UxaA family hydrolase [Tamaricihabitans halophyticus]TCP44727.1 (2R)-sulfolactate sulfo-lyase subunit alpha [Tamaricihabitans halophyticus]